jgi:hypothetical protein
VRLPKKILLSVAVTTAVLITLFVASSRYRDQFMTHDLFNAPARTLCVGRYLIDVPAQYSQENYSYRIDGVGIKWMFEIKEKADFDQQLAARETELKDAINEYGRASLETSNSIGTERSGRLFIHGREKPAYWFEQGEKVISDEGLTGEAWLWIGSHAVELVGKSLGTKSVSNVSRLAAVTRSLAPNEIPDEPGYCMEMFDARAFIADAPGMEQREITTLEFGLENYPDVKFQISMFTNGDKLDEPLLARHARNKADPNSMTSRFAFATTTLREGHRTIHGIGGDELAESVREENGTRGLSFGWEPLGKPNDPMAPAIVFDMKTGYSRNGPVASSLSKEVALKLWDTIVGSIRLRPTAPPKSAPEAPKAPLGAVSTTGQWCPQKGVWRAERGEQRFIDEGERMPKTRTAGAPNFWQRLSGTLSEEYVATRWTLVAFNTDSSTLNTRGEASPVAGPGGTRPDDSPPGGHA